MRNVHMKFQNPSIHRSKVNTHTHTQTDTHTHTDRQAESNMPFQLFQSWGHNKSHHIPSFYVKHAMSYYGVASWQGMTWREASNSIA